MRLILSDEKSKVIKVIPEVYDDLWVLHQVIEPKDVIRVRTFRTYRPTPTAKPEKKPVFLEIEVEKIDFHKHMKTLRLLGRILGGRPEELINIGSYHSYNVELGQVLTIVKHKWDNQVVSRLEHAVRMSKKPKVGFVLVDDEKALFAVLRIHGLDVLSEVYSHTSKRDPNHESNKRKYLVEVIKGMLNMKDQGVERIVLAGPGFTKDEVKHLIEEKYPDLDEIVWVDTCSYVEVSGIEELLKKDVVERILGEHQQIEESKWMDKIGEHLAKDDGLIVYGLKEVERAIEYGMVSDLFVSISLIHDDKIRDLIQQAESHNVKIHIFSDDSPAGERLKGLTGIVGLLYYPMK